MIKYKVIYPNTFLALILLSVFFTCFNIFMITARRARRRVDIVTYVIAMRHTGLLPPRAPPDPSHMDLLPDQLILPPDIAVPKDTVRPRVVNGYEDMLSMPKMPFLSDYKNPCWRETSVYHNGTGTETNNTALSNITRIRCLPYFHIIGVCKSGTTDLFARLEKHPDVLGNSGINGKETQWWGRERFGLGAHPWETKQRVSFRKYISYFDKNIPKMTSDTINIPGTSRPYHHIICGDGSPTTFWDLGGWPMIPQNNATLHPSLSTPDLPMYTTPHCIRRIHPDVKMILMLRNPTERLYSDYIHIYHDHEKTPETFHQRVVTQIERFKNCTRNQNIRACLFNRTRLMRSKVRLQKGFYAEYLKAWWSVFPKKQILILRTEQYSQNITENLQKVFRFLGVREFNALTPQEQRSIAFLPRQYARKLKDDIGPMLNKTRDLLNDFHRPYNEELAVLLGDDGYRWTDG